MALPLTISTLMAARRERYSWTEFGQWHEDEFCEATDPTGTFESHSNRDYKEYHDRIKAISLRADGRARADIARAIGRPEDFVERWWGVQKKDVPVPPGVQAWQCRIPECWRDVTIVRRYAHGRGIYEEVLGAFGTSVSAGSGHLQWEQDWSLQKLNDGAQAIRYTREGKMRPMGCMKASGGYWGGCPTLDRTLQQFTSDFDLKGRHLAIMLLYYAHGHGGQGAHRHDCVSALLSFGSPRILTIDSRPYLLRDGDLVIFGTQRHGVPVMPECEGGRISVPFFFYPKGVPMRSSFSTSVADGNGRDGGPSKVAADLQREAQLGGDAEAAERKRLNEHVVEVDRLASMGFPRPRCAQVLMMCDLDVEQAAQILLDQADSRAQVAVRLRELQATPGACAAEVRALAAQVEEFEQEDLRCACIETENAERDLAQEREDAENWDGRGDLMVMTCRQRHLQIEMQQHATVGALSARINSVELFGILAEEGVAALYDLRPDPDAAAAQLRSVALKHVCDHRGMIYKSMALGRDGTGGIERHLMVDEGRHALAELVWHSRRRRTAYLADAGRHRKAIAEALRRAGHSVQSLDGEGLSPPGGRRSDIVPVATSVASEDTDVLVVSLVASLSTVGKQLPIAIPATMDSRAPPSVASADTAAGSTSSGVTEAVVGQAEADYSAVCSCALAAASVVCQSPAAAGDTQTIDAEISARPGSSGDSNALPDRGPPGRSCGGSSSSGGPSVGEARSTALGGAPVAASRPNRWSRKAPKS